LLPEISKSLNYRRESSSHTSTSSRVFALLQWRL